MSPQQFSTSQYDDPTPHQHYQCQGCYSWVPIGHVCEAREVTAFMRWRPIRNALICMTVIAACIVGIALAWTGRADAHGPRPIQRPAGLLQAKHECSNSTPLVECRAALRRALSALAWERKQRLHHRILPASNLTPVEVGRELAARHRWGDHQFACLYTLWNRESGWQVHDRNWSSQADGIPQANPASKMRSAGRDYRTNAATQIRWGLGYIKARYGSPCAALEHSNTHGYY